MTRESENMRLLHRFICTSMCTLGGDKVNMLTHTYPHRPPGEDKSACGLISNLVTFNCKLRKEYGCALHWVSLLRRCVIKQYNLKLHYLQVEGLGYTFPTMRLPLAVVFYIGEYIEHSTICDSQYNSLSLL